jgi:signal transduction histidine kinase
MDEPWGSRQVDIRCNPILDDAGNPKGFLAIELDISNEQKALSNAEKAREEAIVARDAARAASRAKDAFLASMSHELRTPLNAIIGFAELLMSGIAGEIESDQQRQYISDMHRSGKHILSLINEILDYSRVEAGKSDLNPENVNVCDTIKNVLEIMHPLMAARKVVYEFHSQSNREVARVDEKALRQILVNLIGNAIKFSRDGGKIQIDVRDDEGKIVFEVLDHGIGISKLDIAKLGQPFVQVSSPYLRGKEGSGLGLAIVTSLLKQMNGQIEFGSEKGSWTKVIVKLPAALEERETLEYGRDRN